MQQEQSRKRAAPSAWPQGPQQSSSRHTGMPSTSDMSDDQFLSWTANSAYQGQNNGAPMPQYAGSGALGDSDGQQQSQSQALVSRLNSAQIADQDPYAAQLQRLDHNRSTPAILEDSDEDDVDLEARAQAAKREAATKRPPRLIPPFIQKLSSFLDDPKNSELIRWADDGRSFVVLDEDRFANELIPEMFKHNNYASFVRQLNMYGFHKKVGLSDNSMRASEKKAKLPSGYRHKYFRRGRPDLLWLIEKPKPGVMPTKKKLARHDNADGPIMDDADDQTTAAALTGNTDMVTLPKSDLAHYRGLQREVQDLQKSQQHIYTILKTMRDENKQYIKQAGAMLANHERHESSINAILQFLATFYNQSLQGGNNGPNMFPAPMQPQQSSVVEEMSDYHDSPTDFNAPSRPVMPQRRPLLLTAPPIEEASASTNRKSPIVKQENSPTLQVPQNGNSPSSARSSSRPSPEPGQHKSPQGSNDRKNDMLNVIRRSNAQQSAEPRYDLSTLQQYSQNANGGQGPLTPEQRDTMLSLLANQPDTDASGQLTNNPAAGNLNYLQQNQDQLSMLQRLQEEHDNRLQNLAGRLQPLSPSGSIPGLEFGPSDQNNQNQMYSGQYNPQSEFDFNNYLNDDLLDGGYEANPDFDIDWNNLRGDGTNTNGDDLFGESTNDQGQDTATAEHSNGGRIVGSVGSSSGAPTPRPRSAQGEADTEQGDAGKRRRLHR